MICLGDGYDIYIYIYEIYMKYIYVYVYEQQYNNNVHQLKKVRRNRY